MRMDDSRCRSSGASGKNSPSTWYMGGRDLSFLPYYTPGFFITRVQTLCDIKVLQGKML